MVPCIRYDVFSGPFGTIFVSLAWFLYIVRKNRIMTYGDLIKLLEPYKDKELKFTGCSFENWTSVEFYEGSKALLVLQRTMGTSNIKVAKNFQEEDL